MKGTGITKAYACGSSMGAYGALLFGLELGIPALAFSPETILGLPRSRSAGMMPEGTPLTVPDLTDRIIASTQPITIISGELDPVDMYCARSLVTKHAPQLTVATMCNEEHTIMRTLNNADRLVKTISDFVEDKPLARLMKEGRGATIEGFAENFYQGWVHFRNGAYEDAIAPLCRARDAYPISPGALYLLSRSYLRTKNFQDGLTCAATCTALDPENPDYRLQFAHMLRVSGYMLEALHNLEQTLQLHPEAAKAHFEMGQVLHHLKRRDEAVAAWTRALELDPTNPSYQKRLNS